MTDERLVLTGDEIAQRVREIAADITRDYAGKQPVLIGVLKGSIVFLADLCRAIDLDVRLDFMSISSYGAGTSGVVRILKDLDISIE
jgi:hypoxanthine phosphoribosyltransferase